MRRKISKINSVGRKGFVLPFTMLIASLILFVTLGSMTLLSKQQYFSRTAQKSQVAYYAADDALTCTMDIDDTYIGDDGLGIFPYSTSTTSNVGTSQEPSYTYLATTLDDYNYGRDPAQQVTLSDIKCGQAAVFDSVGYTKFRVELQRDFAYHYINPVNNQAEIEYGLTSTFNMKFPLGGGQYRCAKVTVNKTQTFRQIISQGYSSCDDARAIERAIVNTTIIN